MGFEDNIGSNGGTDIQIRKLIKVIDDDDLLSHFQIFHRPQDTIFDDTKIRVFYLHDVPGKNETKLFRTDDILKQTQIRNIKNSIHHSVFISDWQYQLFSDIIGYPDSNVSVIEAGFDPIDINWNEKKSPIIRFCYTSLPSRGLEILVPVFAEFAKKHDDVQLDVFSSFKIYGWENMDEQFKPLFKAIEDNPSMNYHGFVPHDDLIEYLKTAHCFAYPCTFLETSCKAMLEAMSAGLVCIHPNIAALPLTSGHLNIMYQYKTNQLEHSIDFANTLEYTYSILKNNYSEMIDILKTAKNYIDNRYNIQKIKMQWEFLLKTLLVKYPIPESRKIKK